MAEEFKVTKNGFRFLLGDICENPLGLVSSYSTIPNIRNNLRVLYALEFCHLGRVVEYFEFFEDEIIRNFRDISGVRELLDYFENNYIGRFRQNGREEPRFSKEIWRG
ncbi:hypothetical protein RF11_06828 [Thelohanellus kitauei]|uniref:Uncharacterized protein n=1 Tax=Thelohanellus kitauei TaxID=669202 RepID=A0A0C2MW14_THEKT|nr:hypothetical protein RF11_06828 [Thelohanellus kitauei]